MSYKNVYLKRGKEESLKRFHPWIFSGAIHHQDDGIQEGEIVRVITASGEFIAVGHYQIGSIAVRVLSFRDIVIDHDYWKSRLESALKMRISIGIADNDNNNTYRLCHGEGDNLPGLVIDCYGRTAVMQAHSVGMHMNRNEICQALIEVMDGRIENVYYKSETTLPYKADLEEESGFLYGKDADNIAIENGLKFHIDWLKGQKTGFFVDQRDNRSLLEKYSKGKSVLNMFCYTGGFSVYSMRGGAKLVHSVDSSAKAVELVNQNIELDSFCLSPTDALIIAKTALWQFYDIDDIEACNPYTISEDDSTYYVRGSLEHLPNHLTGKSHYSREELKEVSSIIRNREIYNVRIRKHDAKIIFLGMEI